MNEKDKQIERLFDDYASSLEPNERLADKARQTLRKPKERRGKKRRAVKVGIAAACAAVAVVTVVSVAPILAARNSGRSDNSVEPAPDIPRITFYSVSEIRARRVNADFARAFIDTADIENAQVFSEDYYACYIKATNEFVYLKAILGVDCGDGNLQMSIVAEKSTHAGEELAEQYRHVIGERGFGYTTDFVAGEYVTMAYWKSDKYNYYVSALGNAYGAQYLAADIIGAEI